MPQLRPLRLVVALMVLLTGLSPAAAITDQEVGAAIKRMQDWLYSRQNAETGEWKTTKDFHQKDGFNVHGEHVLVTYALLASGHTPQDPRIEKAIRFLRSNELNGTYTRGVSAHVWASLPDQYKGNWENDAQWLLKAQTDSLWDYGPVRKTRVDHSTTQYGLLGLWECSKRGYRTPPKIWQDAVVHFLKVQTPDGGWTYDLDADAKPRGSMVAAGLTVLYVAQQELFRDADRPPKEVTEAINKGLAWLDKNFTPTTNPGGGGTLGYYLYGIERVGLAGGIKTFAGKDWFEAGATELIRREKNAGSINGDLNETAFALMFLARGQVPVWISKLQIPGAETNNRPNDIYFLTRFLSDQGEQELNWQSISIDTDAALWQNAPVAYLSAPGAVTFSDSQRANLKNYLDRGGLLLANAENNSVQFVASMRKLAEEMYPHLKLEPIAEDSGLVDAIYKAEPRTLGTILGMSNGARDLMLVTQKDWGKTFQGDEKHEDEAWQLATNLYSLVTDRGRLANRLGQTMPVRKAGATKKGDIKVARAQYEGAWNLERNAWGPIDATLFNSSGYGLTQSDVQLADLATSDAALVHLAGNVAVTLTDPQKQAIKAYADKGGTVLVETIGGRGDFAGSIEEQLRPLFGVPATQVPASNPLFTGSGLPGATPIKRVIYRPYSVVRMSARDRPLLAAFSVGDRPAVLVSREDLSLGVLGMQRWGINGYQPEPARQVLGNILLAANKARGK